VEQTAGWTYNAGPNSITFSPLPPPGARIEITYRMICQS